MWSSRESREAGGQLAGTINSCLCIVRIQSFFKLTGSICTKSYTLAGQTDVGSVKAGCLEQHGLYIICDHGVLTTHDTSHTDCFLTVADHQYIFIQCTLLSIQSHEFLIVSRTADNDFFICDLIQIISMHRLAILFHYVVGNINHIIDRTDAYGCQSSLHPFR